MTQQDTPGQPEQEKDPQSWTAPDAQATGQTISLSTLQAAQQVSVNERTIRRWIDSGVHLANGEILRLKARYVQTKRGQELQIFQNDLEEFLQDRNRSATEGRAAGEKRAVQQLQEQQQSLSTSLQLLSAELERRDLALAQAQETIERLAREVGQQAGRNEELERLLERQDAALSQAREATERLAREIGRQEVRNETLEQQLADMREQVAKLERERDQWQQAAQAAAAQPQQVGKPQRRIRLLKFGKGKEENDQGQQ
jgi:chromosome segregation ATPase